MKNLMLVGMAGLILGLGSADASLSGPELTRRAPKSVKIDDLTTETQKSVESPDGINMIWYLPPEFWEASFAADPTLDPAEVRDLQGMLQNSFVIAIVRGDLNEWGMMTFHPENRVAASYSVTFVDEHGKSTELQRAERIDPAMGSILGTLKPMLSAAMGEMGQNFHFFVYSDPAESRRVSPFEPGTLEVSLKRLGTDAAGTVAFEFPLDSLFEPRTCPHCAREQQIRWNFCPFDGTDLNK